MGKTNVKNERCAGILLPISSLPSPYGIGDLGKEAYKFVDYLVKCGQKVWQILPIGPTSFGDSPYQSFSAFAGNPYFIDLDKLIKESLLNKDEVKSVDWGKRKNSVDYQKIFNARFKILRLAFNRYNILEEKAYKKFCEKQKYWLDDYCLYMAVKFHFKNKSWLEWDDDIRLRKPDAIKKYKKLLADDIAFWCFLQFKFFEQWYKLKLYANENGIKIIGDIPIYVSMDSADTWANSEQFLLDDDHRPTVVAGCPPDFFSEDGQLWGNSIYDWKFMEKNNFKWWRNRISFSSTIYDVSRIDHFIGIVRYYAIPADDTTARNGQFHKGPGLKLIKAIDESVGKSEIIAEDLGVVVEEVKKLMKRSGYPGMKILQFAFDGDATNEHLPINYEKNCCVYLGTHDNDTAATALEQMPEPHKEFLMKYLGKDNLDDGVWDLIRLAYASVSRLAVMQMQNVLELDDSARMNTPATVGNNWKWRLTKQACTEELAKKLSDLAKIYGR